MNPGGPASENFTTSSWRLPPYIRAALLALAGITYLLVAWPAHSGAVELRPGDIVIAAVIGNPADNDHGLVRIDPVTGDRTIISDDTVGTGPSLLGPIGVALASDGDLLVGSGFSLFRVDPATGNRTVVSANGGPGAGPDLLTVYGVQQVGNRIIVSDATGSGGGRVLSIDPLTGDRAFISGGGVGTGPGLSIPSGFAVVGDDIFTTAYPNRVVLKVNLSTGDRSIFYQGPLDPQIPVDIDVGPLGDLFMSTRDFARVYRLDPVTASLTVISSTSVGTGPLLTQNGPAGIGVAADGTIFLAEDGLQAVLRIDPLTGNRTILSDAATGTGPIFANPQDLLVIANVPEPSTIALAVLGLLTLVASRTLYLLRRGA